MASLQQTVPAKTALLVEFPGYISNPEAAVQLLGGTAAIAAATIAGSQVLPLRLRPGDPLAHPLLGERQPNRKLMLLRIARRTSNAEAGPSDTNAVQAEIVARIPLSYTFGGMADFQYLSCHTKAQRSASSMHPASADDVDTAAGPYGPETSEPLLVVPPTFSRVDVPLDYGFRVFYAAGKDGAGGSRKAAQVLDFNVPSVPPAPAPPQQTDAAAAREAAVQGLFQERPIWSPAAVAEKLPGVPRPALESLLSRACYRFRQGPWKGLWIARGYDPRASSEARLQQALEYHLPRDWYQRIAAVHTAQAAAAAKLAPPSSDAAGATAPVAVAVDNTRLASVSNNLADLHRFAAVPSSTMTLLQVGDLWDEEISAVVQRAQPQLRCSAASGWFSAGDWAAISSAVQQRFQRLLDGDQLQQGEAQPMDTDSATAVTSPRPPLAGAAAVAPARGSNSLEKAKGKSGKEREDMHASGLPGLLPGSYLETLMGAPQAGAAASAEPGASGPDATRQLGAATFDNK